MRNAVLTYALKRIGLCESSFFTDPVRHRVCKSGYPLCGYPDLSVNFMAAKNPDILVANPDIRYQDIQIFPLILWQPKI